jgi:hypothetical protein
MFTKSKMITLAVVATMGMAAPAFAEVWSTGTADYAARHAQVQQFTEAPAARIFDMVPQARSLRADPPAYRFGPALNGGGSMGYNQLLKQDN